MINRILSLIVVLLPLISCVRGEELTPVINGDGEQIVITAGFEQTVPVGTTQDTKTYVVSGKEIRWTSSGIDKVIYVFDSSGKKNVFESASTKTEAVRSFSGTVSQGTRPKYIIWTGRSKNNDNTVLTESSGGLGSENITSGGSASLDTKAGLAEPVVKFSGTCLEINPVQTITNQNSFVTDGNISVMKEGDECLKSVFGYLRYRIPVSALGDYATIKSIKITADENIAGQVEIDYSGEEPVASVVANGSKSITVNTRWQTRSPAHYEPGLYFAILPVGTYHNVSIEITTFTGAATSQDAPTNKPFTIYCRGEVVVERGKYTDLGTLPLEKPVASNPGFKFDTDYFEEYADPSSGVVSYRIKSSALGWDNSQSQYFVTKAMTDDERFVFFMVQANEFRPNYHSLPTQERSAKILDLETRKMYTFYATDGCYPYLDTKTDKIYYCIRNEEATAAKFYMRDLLNAPDVEVPLADFPPYLVPQGVNKPLKRVLSHLTLTQDRRKVFIDARVVDTFYQGLLDLYTGEWIEWGKNSEVNLTHGQLNPKNDNEALLAIDVWDDTKGVRHPIINDPDGEFNGAGTYPRIQLMTSDGSRRTIRPSDPWNGATHEMWHQDGDHVYWCGGTRWTDNTYSVPVTSGGTHYGGYHIRNVRTGAYECIPVPRSTHVNLSEDYKYATFDDDRPYGAYDTGYYRGGPWRVWFQNRETGKIVAIYSEMPLYAMNTVQPSRIHPDPHPHFVAGDKYIVCTAYGADGNLHWSITPVDQLIAKTQ